MASLWKATKWIVAIAAVWLLLVSMCDPNEPCNQPPEVRPLSCEVGP